MSILPRRNQYSIPEYLELEAQAAYKSEYFSGEIYAMSGGSYNHSLIAAKIGRSLGNALMGKDCEFLNSDLKLFIEAANSFAYPDGMVICGKPNFWEGKTHVVTNPKVVIEVLSDSTAGWDRGGKFHIYQRIPTLKAYVLIEQQKAHIDVYRPQKSRFWGVEGIQGLDKDLILPSLDVSIPMAEIYENVIWE